jgi:transcriptional repressor NrdR
VIGEMVMDKLKDLNEVAYVRFAAIYREFKDVNTFMSELKKLKKEVENKSKIYDSKTIN